MEGRVEDKRWGWRLACRGSIEKKETSHLLRLRKRHQYLYQRSSRIRAPGVVFTTVGTERERPNGQIVSIKRAADERRQKSRKIIDEKREKYKANNGSMQNTLTDSKRATFVILKNHTSTSMRKERFSPSSKAKKEASQNKFVEKGGMPDRVESLEKSIVTKIV